MESKKMFSVKETAELLGLSELEVRQLSRSGKLNPSKSHLRRVRFSENEVLSYKARADASFTSLNPSNEL